MRNLLRKQFGIRKQTVDTVNKVIKTAIEAIVTQTNPNKPVRDLASSMKIILL